MSNKQKPKISLVIDQIEKRYMNIQTLLKLVKRSRTSSKSTGFTLVELLAALAITSVIVSVAGWGLVTLMSGKKVSDDLVDKQSEVNRASDFINDEIRRARFINKSDTMTAIQNGTFTVDGNLFDPNNKTIVLALQIPDTTDDPATGVVDGDTNTNDEMVIYYIQSNEANWRGPQVIHRWGPTFNSNGLYSVDAAGNLNYDNVNTVLIDGIQATDLSNIACPANLTDKTPNNAPSGFYACLGGQRFFQNDNTQAYYTRAQLNINGAFKRQTDTDSTYSDAFSGRTETASRINAAPQDVPAGLANISNQPSITLGSRFWCRNNVPWRIRTTIEIDGRNFVFNEGDSIPSLSSFISGAITPHPSSTNTDPLTNYKISKDGSNLKVEKYDTTSKTWSTVPQGFKITAEPYIAKDSSGNYVVLDPNQGTKRTVDATTGQTVNDPVSIDIDETEIKGGPGNATGCDNNDAAVAVTFDGTSQTKTKSIAQGQPFPPPGVNIENLQQGFSYNNSASSSVATTGEPEQSSTAGVLISHGYIEQTVKNLSNPNLNEYETKLEDNQMVFMFELGDASQKLANGDINKGFDMQDQMVTLTW
jgi:prepilin-type N-terminal cleavage/methylation domain-containing protein